jgi:hypothetical protein
MALKRPFLTVEERAPTEASTDILPLLESLLQLLEVRQHFKRKHGAAALSSSIPALAQLKSALCFKDSPKAPPLPDPAAHTGLHTPPSMVAAAAHSLVFAQTTMPYDTFMSAHADYLKKSSDYTVTTAKKPLPLYNASACVREEVVLPVSIPTAAVLACEAAEAAKGEAQSTRQDIPGDDRSIYFLCWTSRCSL